MEIWRGGMMGSMISQRSKVCMNSLKLWSLKRKDQIIFQYDFNWRRRTQEHKFTTVKEAFMPSWKTLIKYEKDSCDFSRIVSTYQKMFIPYSNIFSWYCARISILPEHLGATFKWILVFGHMWVLSLRTLLPGSWFIFHPSINCLFIVIMI